MDYRGARLTPPASADWMQPPRVDDQHRAGDEGWKLEPGVIAVARERDIHSVGGEVDAHRFGEGGGIERFGDWRDTARRVEVEVDLAQGSAGVAHPADDATPQPVKPARTRRIESPAVGSVTPARGPTRVYFAAPYALPKTTPRGSTSTGPK